MKRIALMLCIFATVMAPVFDSAVQAAGKRVAFSTYLGWGSETDAQYVFFMTELFKYLKAEMKLDGEYKHYSDEREFYRDFVDGKGERYAIVGRREEMVRLIRDHGYTPVLNYTVGGLARNRECLYARKESGIKTVKDLRGHSLGIDQGPFAHSLLRSMLRERPDTFFKSIEETTTGLEAVYMISLKEVDAVFVTDQIIWFLKHNNPGAMRGLEQIACSPEYTFLPLLGRNVKPGFDTQLLSLLHKVQKGQALSQYHNIIKIQKLAFVTVKRKDFQWDIDFYTKAEKDGWVKDYERWRERQERK